MTPNSPLQPKQLTDDEILEFKRRWDELHRGVWPIKQEIVQRKPIMCLAAWFGWFTGMGAMLGYALGKVDAADASLGLLVALFLGVFLPVAFPETRK